MTKRMRDDGTEVVYLGPLERAIGGLFGLVIVALLGFIGHVVWQDHESIAGLTTEIAVIKATQHREGP